MDLSINNLSSLQNQMAETAADIAKDRKARKDNLDELDELSQTCDRTHQELDATTALEDFLNDEVEVKKAG